MRAPGSSHETAAGVLRNASIAGSFPRVRGTARVLLLPGWVLGPSIPLWGVHMLNSPEPADAGAALYNRFNESLGCRRPDKRGGISWHRNSSMRRLYIVTEEAWSLSSKVSDRKLVSLSDRPLFSGGSMRIAYAYARQRASEFKYLGVFEEGDDLYWWGRNEGDCVNRRFVIKPAPPSSPVFVDKHRQRRGPPAAPQVGAS